MNKTTLKLLVSGEINILARFANPLEHGSNLECHRNKGLIVALVQKSLKILNLLVELFLYVILHLVRD